MFRNSLAGYAADMALTPPIILIGALITGIGVPWALAGIVGFALWQVFEWFMHRHILHGWAKREHWKHHREPTGEAGIPPWLTLPAVVALFVVLVLLLGSAIGGGLFTGLAFGYWTYNLTHWAIHAGHWPRAGILGGIARRHDLHHRGVAANFNVLLPWADMAFGTYRSAT